MACPYANGIGLPDVSEEEMERGLNSEALAQVGTNNVAIGGGVTYPEYLKLDQVLAAQQPLSKQDDGKSVHDEHLFIVIHQAYELWFKQILYEVDSIRDIFCEDKVDECHMLTIITRLTRINMIMKLLCDQFSILETMTPLDFIQFRTFLGASSGFQSLQFRILENSLGIRDENRVRYNQQYYKDVFNDPASIKALDESVTKPSLLRVIERWLERTPGLKADEFHFWNRYKSAVNGWLNNEWLSPANEENDPEIKKLKLAEHSKIKDAFDSVLIEETYNKYIARGERRISHRAFQGALMIYLYRDEPRFHQPHQMLTLLQDLDSHFTKWRYNHVMLVQRMIGSKLGTGGSSGYQYLRSTVSDRYKVFIDLFNLSTYIIPRSYIPPLTQRMKKTLSMMLKHPELTTHFHTTSTSSDDNNETQEARFILGERELSPTK